MTVYLEPIGGLCNRMRVIASAYAFVKPHNGTIIVKWVANAELNCPSKALFSLPDSIRTVEVTESTPWNRFLAKAAYFRLRLGYHTRINDASVLAAKQDGDLIPRDKTYYETCETFHKDSRGLDFSLFRPVPDLQKKAEKKILQISENGKYRVIGLHIRRTDNTVSIQSSPTELFCQVLDARLKEDPTVRFYIATDDASLKEFFAGKYNVEREVVFFSDSSDLRRDAADGIKAAYIELLTLSMTERIYGSRGSSYSDTAAAIGRIPLEAVTADTIADIL